MDEILTVNDFFCGAGGMGLGFKNAGFEIAGAWDFDKFAIESYKHNVGEHATLADILNMTHEDVPVANVWTFGAPCQAFSVAGKQLGMTFKCPNCKHEEAFEGELIIDRTTFCSKCKTLSEPKDIRGIMFFEIMRLLKTTEKKPPVIMLENVKGVSKFLNVIAYEYEKRGYKLYQTLYNSKYWGVPQNRERYFVIGIHENIEKEFVFPVQQTKHIPKLNTVIETIVDEKYYINSEKSKSIIELAKGKIDVNKGVLIKGDIMTRKNPQRQFGFSEKLSYTLRVAVQNGYVDSNLRVRKLTPREYANLQGFPKSFEIVVSDSQAYKQFGNAVSVPVAQAIAEQIKLFIQENKLQKIIQ